ncbi:MAG: hypothetical protein M1419_00170, partial [Bacteroidetes bacterium]|nr:hypothetical protein [Bacteroidota bacterium]
MKRIKFKKIATIFVAIFSIIIINACEDAIPSDYIEEKFVEAYLIVDEPIRNIVLMSTQPVNKKFDYANSLIRNAEVKIIGDGKEFILSIDTALHPLHLS